MQILLSNSQAGPGRTVKQEQEKNSCNHVQTFIFHSVHLTLKNIDETQNGTMTRYNYFGPSISCRLPSQVDTKIQSGSLPLSIPLLLSPFPAWTALSPINSICVLPLLGRPPGRLAGSPAATTSAAAASNSDHVPHSLSL